IAQAIARQRGAVIVPPYNDPLIVAGQGTVGREIAHGLAAQGLRPDAVIVPCGGGGLIAGCAIALTAAFRRLRIYAAEPKGWDDTRRSLALGKRVGPARPGAPTLCDALLSPLPGEFTFPINRRLLAGGLVADDTAVLRAMGLAARHLKIVLEPGGAVALAVALSRRFEARGRTVVVVASGGNVDPTLCRKALRALDVESRRRH
ncbi:MAG TPA: pyridoxal-phosphate dependent enzyme, partial [Alphaproteobacteria bacterium]|nr:pyridoxal-phosphate dependent enzyme [Alphaproteobacteria bacterium]